MDGRSWARTRAKSSWRVQPSLSVTGRPSNIADLPHEPFGISVRRHKAVSFVEPAGAVVDRVHNYETSSDELGCIDNPRQRICEQYAAKLIALEWLCQGQ